MTRMAQQALVIGYGSIGKRHDAVLSELGLSTAIYSRRAIDHPCSYQSLDLALSDFAPDYVVIANRTSEHLSTLHALKSLGYAGRILVEKPLFSELDDIPEGMGDAIRVGYNLRFHPILLRLRELLQGQTICTFQAYVGQYLPTWRPGTDYRDSYSARADEGGGALLDLSHDIDYTIWLLGGWSRVTAMGGKTSALEIDSDDAFSLLLDTPRCPVVHVHVNYLNRTARREIVVNTTTRTYVADLVGSRILIDGAADDQPIERNETYAAMHRDAMGPDTGLCCTAPQGLALMRLLDAARQASIEHVWITP
ncbi:Gfo/Idh/MocA family protein [Tropicibacter sp. Alg240-R139]|uniref:Gfo/Idh/MocA family protein n=1 Tax=Tropicibacter sp. Alg240-R139 TaxID=2305991 RepID=UPI00196854B5|nr:Gfo/Idh/MocA family oxidoreductase [Tropicibacter sp. Alg240-R139]